MKDVKVNCETCVKAKAPETVPYITYESMLAQNERVIRRLWITVIVMIAVLIGTNLAWIIYEHQFEDVRIEQDSETGTNNFIGNDGDIYNYPEGDVANGEADDNNPTP